MAETIFALYVIIAMICTAMTLRERERTNPSWDFRRVEGVLFAVFWPLGIVAIAGYFAFQRLKRDKF